MKHINQEKMEKNFKPSNQITNYEQSDQPTN